MNILGISGQDRDAAAALIRDGAVVAAVEEEKLDRTRHVGMNYTGGLPIKAIEFCLRKGVVKLDQIDYIAYYTEPRKVARRNISFRASRLIKAPGAASIQAFPYYFVDSLNGYRQRVRTRHIASEKFRRARFISVNHQKAHASSAFYVSGFERAAIIVAGNVGDMKSTALMTADPNGLRVAGEARFPNSIGMVYSAVTAALGFPAGDDHKTMWLSAAGEDEFSALFADMIRVDRNGLPTVNLSYFEPSFKGAPALSDAFFKRTGSTARTTDSTIGRVHRNIAASLQNRINTVLTEMAQRLRKRSRESNLCMAGGVALNSLSNTAIEHNGGFEKLFIQPAAGNAGCSIGAAQYVWHDVLGNRDNTYVMSDAFLGPQFTEEEVKVVLDNCKLAYEYFLTEDKLVAEVAALLAQGKIVGWFRGAMEFGPRTLGARSILASPVNAYTADNLNTYVKHREDFRPFSSSVPEERAGEYFEESSLTGFLQGVCRVKEDKVGRIPAAVFGNGLARVHTVARKTDRAFWKLLVKFGEITSVPILLNTSFNLFGEPVVSTPRDAVRGFYCSGLDCLVVENFLVQK